MNEASWLTSTDAAAMLEHLRGGRAWGPPGMKTSRLISDRQCRLFAVACFESSNQEMLASGDYGLFNYGKDGEKITCLVEVCQNWCAENHDYDPPQSAKASILREIIGNPFRPVELPREDCRVCRGAGWVRIYDRMVSEPATCEECNGTGKGQCPWVTPLVRTMAETIYAERTYEDMPILADALSDAGCDNEDVLRHCRLPQVKRRLSQIEVDALPAGVLVEVTWSGGNGPHVYTTGRDKRNNLYLGVSGRSDADYRQGLGFVGEKPLTEVWTVPHSHTRGCWVIDLLTGRD